MTLSDRVKKAQKEGLRKKYTYSGLRSRKIGVISLKTSVRWDFRCTEARFSIRSLHMLGLNGTKNNDIPGKPDDKPKIGKSIEIQRKDLPFDTSMGYTSGAKVDPFDPPWDVK